MTGNLKHDGESWYVEYIEQNPSSILNGTNPLGTPSKFVISKDNLDKIASGEWLAAENKKVDFELKSLPHFPFYEASLNKIDMRNVYFFMPTASIQLPDKNVETITKYDYHVRFDGNTAKIRCDRYILSSNFIIFQNKHKNENPISDGMGAYLNEYIYEDVALYPASRTAIYRIDKVELQAKN